MIESDFNSNVKIFYPAKKFDTLICHQIAQILLEVMNLALFFSLKIVIDTAMEYHIISLR